MRCKSNVVSWPKDTLLVLGENAVASIHISEVVYVWLWPERGFDPGMFQVTWPLPLVVKGNEEHDLGVTSYTEQIGSQWF